MDTYTVFLDGAPWVEGVSEAKANAVVASYDGEKDCWKEKDPDETPED